MKKAAFKLIEYSFILLITIVVAVFIYVIIISRPVYLATKQPHSYTSGLYTSDQQLGYKILPNADGHFIWSYGDSVSISTDERSFRVNRAKSDRNGTTKRMLFLGDSFTFGEELSVDSTYPFLLGKALEGKVLNASVSGYGYAQMLSLGEKYINELDPEVVFVQISPWLADRATSRYMPAPFFKVPVCYFDRDGNIASPEFISPVLEMTQSTMLDHYRHSDQSIGDMLSFVWSFTLPVYVNELWQQGRSLFANEQPLDDPLKATDVFMDNLLELSKGRELVLLVMGYQEDRIGEFQKSYAEKLGSNKFVTIVPLDSTFYQQEGVTDRASFERRYNFWHGDPPVLVDYHYNAIAHQLIANSVLQMIEPQKDTISVGP